MQRTVSHWEFRSLSKNARAHWTTCLYSYLLTYLFIHSFLRWGVSLCCPGWPQTPGLHNTPASGFKKPPFLAFAFRILRPSFYDRFVQVVKIHYLNSFPFTFFPSPNHFIWGYVRLFYLFFSSCLILKPTCELSHFLGNWKRRLPGLWQHSPPVRKERDRKSLSLTE